MRHLCLLEIHDPHRADIPFMDAGGRTHSPYLAAGVTVATSKRREFVPGNTRYDSSVFGAVTAGYRYRSERGIVIRPTVSHIIIDGDDGFWPGITLGIVF